MRELVSKVEGGLEWIDWFLHGKLISFWRGGLTDFCIFFVFWIVPLLIQRFASWNAEKSFAPGRPAPSAFAPPVWLFWKGGLDRFV